MSQIMESMLNRGLAPTTSELPSLQQNQGIDPIKILWRWKWLPILGAIIGAGVGYMFYTKAPAKYISRAMVQVVSAVPTSSIANMELYDPDKVALFLSRNDESRVIKSQKILTLAVREGNLTKQFPELSEHEIIFKLMHPNSGVEVTPAEKGDRIVTEQLFISYIANSPDTSQAVVNAVVAGYQKFLEEEYKFVDDEQFKFFSQTEKKLESAVSELTAEYEKFRIEAQSKSILWNADNPVDPFFDDYLKKKGQLEDMVMLRNKIKSTLETVESSMKDGNSDTQEILMLLNDDSDLVMSTIWNQLFDDPTLEGDAVAESERLEREQLLGFESDLEYLTDSLGKHHPTVKRTIAMIEATKQRIVKAKEAESEKEKEKLAAAREHFKKRMLSKKASANKQASSEKNASESANPVVDGASTASITDPDSTAIAEEDSENEEEISMEEQTDQFLRMNINALTKRYHVLGMEEELLSKLVEQDRAKSMELQEYIRKDSLLKEKRENIHELHTIFSDRLRAVDLVQTNPNQKILKELNPAEQGSFHGPFPLTYIGAGALVGILLMSGLAVLMDMADRSYRSPDEIVADLGKPVLGHIPAMDLPNIKKVIDTVDPSIITLHHSRGRIAEAFRSVRTGLFFSSRGSELKVVQVTSPVPGDGKSTLSSNLAVAMAQSGRRVLLIDADFRRPRLQKLFGFDADVGMAQLVAGQCELDDATYTSCVANLSIMPGGKRPNNPAELLSSNRFAELIEIVREKYDIVIIDTPPLLAVSDPSVVASVVDGVVLAMRLRRNVKPLATRAFRVLESVDAQVLGVVVNGVSTEAAYGGYGYNYSYNDYRYSYRSSYGYGYGKYGKYGYGKYGKYTSYSTGYIEDKQAESAEASQKSDANS